MRNGICGPASPILRELTISTGTTGPRRFRQTQTSKYISAHQQAHWLRHQVMSMPIRLQAALLICEISFRLSEGSCFGMPPGRTVCHFPSLASISAGVSSYLYAANGNYAASIKGALSGNGNLSAVQKNSGRSSDSKTSSLWFSNNEGRGLGDGDISAVTNL